MVAKPISVGNRDFRTKTEAQTAIRAILDVRGRIVDPEQQKFLLDLLAMHPTAADKIGVGVDYFESRTNPAKPDTYTPYLVRTDGSETDWSYTKCLRAPSHDEEVRRAMRDAINDQRDAFRRATFAAGNGRCAICHVNLDGDGGQVDHDNPTFVDLAWEYATAMGGWHTFEVDRADGMIGVALANADVAEAWSEYHRVHATLRLLCDHDKLTRLKGPRKQR